MKSIFFKWSLVCILSICIALFSSVTAFASESEETVFEDIYSETVMTTYPQTSSVVVPANDYVTMRFTLSSTKSTMRFVVNAFSSSTSGTLSLYLYDSNNNFVQNWTMGVNEAWYQNFSYPDTGNWMLVIISQNATTSTDVFAGWVDPDA